MNSKINLKKTSIGIELGSTTIKAVLIDDSFKVIASGKHLWENKLENGIWTYSLDEIENGLKDCFSDLKKNFYSSYETVLNETGSIGVSAMMHGYFVLDKEDHLLVPFRTWRNNCAEKEAGELSELFNFNIPARWSISHLHHAIQNKEEHVPSIAFQTTLAGYIHYRLTGKKVLGIGEASGMFPIDPKTRNYDSVMLAKYDEVLKKNNLPFTLKDILPSVLVAGENAGSLSKEGALFLDPTGEFKAGVPLCPPEGDAGTGMVATDSISPRTGNISAGTSIFGMIVLDHRLKERHKEIDVVTTPCGDEVGMIHCNNCSSEINAFASLFKDYNKAFNLDIKDEDLYAKLFNLSLRGDNDCSSVIVNPYLSGENITDVKDGCPSTKRSPESKYTLSNTMKAQIYSAFVTLKIGLDIMQKDENIKVEKYFAQGGLFKTKDIAQLYLASALNTPISLMKSAGEGGPYGMAILAMFMSSKEKDLALYLKDKVFHNQKEYTLNPDKDIRAGFETYTANFRKMIASVQEKKKAAQKSHLQGLKEKVLKANLDLVKNHLVLFTWGNVSAIDRETGYVVIKPSGVEYSEMTADDMVVLDLDGNIIEGKLRPSSDTPTHLELYKAHPEIGGIVHTHSTYGVAFAQAGREIPSYGTTHADYFYGPIPCSRSLTAVEIQNDYEKNTGVVINETFKDKDVVAIPACLVRNHGVFAWGKDADQAVYHATVVEEVAKMALLTEQLNPAVKPAPQHLMDKHYQRKHGKNAYYGQKK